MTAAIAPVWISLRFTGRLSSLDADDRNALFNRSASADADVAATARSIIQRVRNYGDKALMDLARDLDNVELKNLEVPTHIIRRSVDSLSTELRDALIRSARNIERVHRAALPEPITVEAEPGVVVTRRPDPLGRVGIYAPGGKAAYASSVLMTGVPARIAGVREIILCSPPSADGQPSREVLAAAAIAGISRVFAVGGAGAIAAMAIGTESVPRVDRIVGPGNAYVAQAKIQLTSEVSIDSPAGPSELMVIADDSADPRIIAREISAQAEHDARAVVVVIAVGQPVAEKIAAAIAEDARTQPRAETIADALRTRGGVLHVTDQREAIDAANEFAPEHLLIVTRDSWRLAESIRAAGSIFVGESSSVAFGDYMTGANHVLPTGGTARCYSGLSTLDFVRWTTIQSVTRDAARELATDTARLAEAEGLPGHAAAARAWAET